MSVKLPELTIRAASRSERDLIIELWRAGGLTTPYNDPAIDFEFAHDKPNSTVLVGSIEERIVASIMVGHDGHRGWIYYVSVGPDDRRNTYGAQIVAGGERWLQQLGVRKVMLLIRESNTKVEAFYSKLGYETVPRIVMQKWLGRLD